MKTASNLFVTEPLNSGNCSQPNKIRIAYILGSLASGGAERQLLQLLKGLDRSRFEPSLILFDCATAHRANGLVSNIFNLAISSHSNSRWTLKGVKTGIAAIRLARYLRLTRPHIVQAILPASVILAAAATKLASVPVLIGSRRSPVCYRSTKLLSIVDRSATRQCTVMLGNSEAVVRELIEVDGLDARLVRRIPNGVDSERFHPGVRANRRRYGWSDEHVVFGMVANFIPYKRHIDFIAAAEAIARRNANARFLMAGDDSRGILDALKSEIRTRGLDPLFTIIVGASQPENLYPAMDVYVCTSETEGLSNVLLEAGAAGLPIIATRVGGNPEVVVHGSGGFLVETHAPESIVSPACRFAVEPSLRRAMGAYNRERVVREFSLSAMVEAHEKLYSELVEV